MVNTENIKVYEKMNQNIYQIRAEHRRRVLSALDDFHRGRKEPPCRERQMELFDEHQKEGQYIQ